jgi:hypothetical protein
LDFGRSFSTVAGAIYGTVIGVGIGILTGSTSAVITIEGNQTLYDQQKGD